jgi:thiol:disulfide interchange protein DsbC
MMWLKNLMVAVTLMAAVSAQAASVASDTDAAIRKNLTAKLPSLQITAINTTPVPDIYQVMLASGEIVHVYKEGNYLLSGEMFAVQDAGGLKNLTETTRSQSRQAAIQSINKSDTITYAAKGPSKGDVYVFTDIDCGYCRKFHVEVPALTQKGITVHYLAWPRAGVESSVGKQMQNIWCSEDPQAALTLAKQGKPITDSKACARQIKPQLDLGFKLGVDGTPAVFLSDGRKVGGYMSADDLAKAMGL